MFTPSPAFEISEFAMSPNNNEVHIYAKKGTKWEVENILKEVGTLILSFFCSNCIEITNNYFPPAWSTCHWNGLGPQEQPARYMCCRKDV